MIFNPNYESDNMLWKVSKCVIIFDYVRQTTMPVLPNTSKGTLTYAGIYKYVGILGILHVIVKYLCISRTQHLVSAACGEIMHICITIFQFFLSFQYPEVRYHVIS